MVTLEIETPDGRTVRIGTNRTQTADMLVQRHGARVVIEAPAPDPPSLPPGPPRYRRRGQRRGQWK